MPAKGLAHPVRTQTSAPPVLVLGLGNILLRDEGVGVHVVRALQRLTLPDNVEVVDGATAGFALVDILAERHVVVVVDALGGNEPPGMVVRLSGDDWLRPGPTPVSLHEVGLAEALTVVCQLGIAPHDVTVIGVRPFVVEAGLELSSEMAALLPRIVKLVLAELGISAATEDKS